MLKMAKSTTIMTGRTKPRQRIRILVKRPLTTPKKSAFLSKISMYTAAAAW